MSKRKPQRRLKTPWPYFGGKSPIAALIWERFGDPANYIEPFSGSAAVLLARPTPPRIETINDIDCYVTNFWRAVSREPELVAYYADWPVSEADLHARHRWLVLSAESDWFRRRMRVDPDYYDAKIAGWWAWGLCCWIGGGWCTTHGETIEGDRRNGRPVLAQDGMGANTKPPEDWEQRPRLEGQGVNQLHDKLPDISGKDGGSGRGINQARGPKQPLPDISGSRGAAGRGVHASGEKGLNNKRPRIGAQKGSSGTGVNVVNSDNGGQHQKKPLTTGSGAGPGVHAKRPVLGGRSERDAGTGINSLNGDNGGRPQLADAFARGRGVHGNDHAGTCEQRRAWLIAWFGDLQDRLRTVRTCCGHWLRVCNSPSVTTRLGTTAVFLDPPYPTHALDGKLSRDGNLYATDAKGRGVLDKTRDEVLAYCIERGPDPLMRIAVCGYDTDGYQVLADEHGWECVAWKAQGGYGNRSRKGNKNGDRERIYFSPHCIVPERDLFPLFAGEVLAHG